MYKPDAADRVLLDQCINAFWTVGSVLTPDQKEYVLAELNKSFREQMKREVRRLE